MKAPIEGRWLALMTVLAGAFAVLLVVAVRFVRLPGLPEQPTRPGTGIGIIRLDPTAEGDGVSDQALLDPDPLFLPTRYNASQLELPGLMRREPGAAFQAIDAKFAYSNAAAGIPFPDTMTLPEQPVEVIRYGRERDPFDGLGRYRRTEMPLTARVAVLEVVETASGRVVLTAPLSPATVPRAVTAGGWEPMELMATIDVTGLVGVPKMWRNSGVDAVDVFFRNYLAGAFHLGERLPPGVYILRVGP